VVVYHLAAPPSDGRFLRLHLNRNDAAIQAGLTVDRASARDIGFGDGAVNVPSLFRLNISARLKPTKQSVRMSSPRPANIPVSTTASLEGWDIDEYLGVATAHVVAGTNVFSDIAGSFSDIFGGQSTSYQKQLASINEAALKDLRQQAAEKGGTALVGLAVDLGSDLRRQPAVVHG